MEISLRFTPIKRVAVIIFPFCGLRDSDIIDTPWATDGDPPGQCTGPLSDKILPRLLVHWGTKAGAL